MDAPRVDQRRMYGDLAWTWPIISPPEDYVSEAEAGHALLQQNAKRPVRSLLHLGCGGGHLDRTLKRHYAVTGVDVSESMLGLARALNPEVAYVRGDMRTVRLDKAFDGVAAFDSISYMLTRDDLRATFATAFEHLVPGGVFLTYAEETAEQFRQNRTRIHTGARDDVRIVLIENAYDPDPRDTTFENTFVYLIRRGGDLRIETDRHLTGLFPIPTWIETLAGVGFEVRSARPHPGLAGGEGYPWFLAIKPG